MAEMQTDWRDRPLSTRKRPRGFSAFFDGWLRPRTLELTFWVALAVGTAIRVVMICSPAFDMHSSDYANVYLQAVGVTEGRIPLYYWGQSYGGAQLQIVTGVVMLVAGTSPVVLALVTLFFWLTAAVLLRYFVQVAAPARGGLAGVTAGIVFWFAGLPMLQESIVDGGFYGTTVLVAAGTLLFAFAIPPARRRWWSWVVLGLLAGLSYWTSPAAVAVAAPAIAFVAIRNWRLYRAALLLVGTVFGLLPYIWSRLFGQLASVYDVGGYIRPENVDNLGLVFTSLLPTAVPFGSHTLVRIIVAGVAVAVIGYLFAHGSRARNAAMVVVGVGALLEVTLIAFGAYQTLDGRYVRYVTFLLIPLAAGIGWWVARWLSASVAVTTLASVATIIAVARGGGFLVTGPAPFDPSFKSVAAYLESHRYEAVYASYYVAGELTASSEQSVRALALTNGRIPGLDVELQGLSPEVFVVYDGGPNASVLDKIASAPSSRTVIGQYVVYVYNDWFDPGSYGWAAR